MTLLRSVIISQKNTGLLLYCYLHTETLLTRYLAVCMTYFHQTFIDDALWDRGERVTIWGQKVTKGGIKYAGNSTFLAC